MYVKWKVRYIILQIVHMKNKPLNIEYFRCWLYAGCHHGTKPIDDFRQPSDRSRWYILLEYKEVYDIKPNMKTPRVSLF